MIKKQIIPTAEPFFMPGGKTACLLIHGFTGAPKEMRPMTDALHKRGLPVMGIRLAGHATQVEDMVQCRYQDWLASVEDGINLLKDTYGKIFLISLSMGGALALSVASYNEVAGVIAMAAPFEMESDWRLRFAHPLSLLIRWKKKEHTNEKKISDGHVDYSIYPMHAIAELDDLTKAMQKELYKIKAPVLLINSKVDPVVPIANAENIKQNLTTKTVEQVILEKSGHVITEDVENEIAFEAAYQFIKKNS